MTRGHSEGKHAPGGLNHRGHGDVEADSDERRGEEPVEVIHGWLFTNGSLDSQP